MSDREVELILSSLEDYCVLNNEIVKKMTKNIQSLTDVVIRQQEQITLLKDEVLEQQKLLNMLLKEDGLEKRFSNHINNKIISSKIRSGLL